MEGCLDHLQQGTQPERQMFPLPSFVILLQQYFTAEASGAVSSANCSLQRTFFADVIRSYLAIRPS
jgi:hypothetical protein